MNQPIKRVLFLAMIVILLLMACAPPPVSTQDSALAQQVLEQSMALTLAADSARAKDQQLIEQAVALTVIAQNAKATEQQVSMAAAATQTPTTETVDTLPDVNAANPTAAPFALTSESTSDSSTPIIDSVTPPEGSIEGGTDVEIKGQNFIVGKQGVDTITRFFFGENEATNVSCDLTTRCKLKSPAGKEGIVLVTAENDDVKSRHVEGNIYDGFKYNGTPKYGCGALTVTPKNSTVFRVGEGFVIKWIITNTGERAWPAGLDVKYSAGIKMSNKTLVEIPITMEPHDAYMIKIDAVAPDNPGTYYMNWVVEGMGCNAYVAITVE